MDRSALQSALAAARARLTADRDGALRAAGLPSGLAYLALPLLQLMAGAADQGEVSDELRALVGPAPRSAILGALADPQAALRSLDGAAPLGQACKLLLHALDQAGDQAALQAQIGITTGAGSTVSNPRMYAAGGDLHVHEAPDDPQQARAERALVDYLRALQHECGPLQISRIDAGDSRYQRPMRLESV